MATKVYQEKTFELSDGQVVTVKPLNIKRLRKFMEVIERMDSVSKEIETLDVLMDACAICIETSLPDLANDRDKLEEVLDVDTIWAILEVAGGVKMNDPNLQAAAAGLVGKS